MMKRGGGGARKLHVWGTTEILAWEGVRILGGVARGGTSACRLGVRMRVLTTISTVYST